MTFANAKLQSNRKGFDAFTEFVTPTKQQHKFKQFFTMQEKPDAKSQYKIMYGIAPTKTSSGNAGKAGKARKAGKAGDARDVGGASKKRRHDTSHSSSSSSSSAAAAIIEPRSELKQIVIDMFVDRKERKASSATPRDISHVLFNGGCWTMDRENDFEDVLQCMAKDFVNGIRWSVGEMYYSECFPMFMDIDFKAANVMHFFPEPEQREEMLRNIICALHASIIEFNTNIQEITGVKSIISVKRSSSGSGGAGRASGANGENGAHVVVHSVKAKHSESDAVGVAASHIKFHVNVTDAQQIYDMTFEKLQKVYDEIPAEVLRKIVDKDVYCVGGNLRMNFCTKVEECITCTTAKSTVAKHGEMLASIAKRVEDDKRSVALTFGKKHVKIRRPGNLTTYKVLDTHRCCEFLLFDSDVKSAAELERVYNGEIQFCDTMKTEVVINETFWKHYLACEQRRCAPAPHYVTRPHDPLKCTSCRGRQFMFIEDSIYFPQWVFTSRSSDIDAIDKQPWGALDTVEDIHRALGATTLHVTNDEIAAANSLRSMRLNREDDETKAMEMGGGGDGLHSRGHHIIKSIESTDSVETALVTLFLQRNAIESAYRRISVLRIQSLVSVAFANSTEKNIKSTNKRMKTTMAKCYNNVDLTDNYAELGYQEHLNKVQSVIITPNPNSPGSRYCNRVRSNHKSNHIYFEIDHRGTCFQRCHDPECAGFKFDLGSIDVGLSARLLTSRVGSTFNPIINKHTSTSKNQSEYVMSMIQCIHQYAMQVIADGSPALLVAKKEEEEREREHYAQRGGGGGRGRGGRRRG